MKVSIIVPVYNSYQYLDKCIGSLVNQTTTEEYEIILVNDCSPDDSLTKLREWESKFPNKIKIIDSKINLRLGGARNLGIQKSKGEYILFVDSDDYICENALELIIDSSFDYDLIMSNKYISWKKDEFLVNNINVNFNSTEIDLDLRKDLVSSNALSVWNGVYKKAFLDKFELKFVENCFYEDTYFTFQVFLETSSIKTIDSPFYYYREDNVESISKKLNDERHWEAEKTANLMYQYGINHKNYNVLKQEIDYRFIDRCIIIYYTYSIKKFDPPRLDKIKEGTKLLKKMFPKYRRNIYYKKYFTIKQRMVFNIARVSPSMYFTINKLMGRI